MKNKNIVDKRNSDPNYLTKVQQYLKDNKIKCIKFNHSLDEIVQNFSSYEATIELSKNFEYLTITNKKPLHSKL